MAAADGSNTGDQRPLMVIACHSRDEGGEDRAGDYGALHQHDPPGTQ